MKLYTVCLCVLWCLGMVAGQQYAPPTFLWQSLVTPQPYNTGYIYSHNATLKYYSQDFQTVYMSNDNFGHNERVLINLGDACNIKNYNDVQALNNFSIQQFTVSQNLMGLVSRGGCDSWQVKLNNIQSLGQFFQLTGVLLYDNVTYPQSQLIQHNPSTTNTPTWPSSFDPPQRNISLMLDNDLRNYSSYLAVYFAPNEFGTAMLGKLNAYSFGPTVSIAQQQYVQMATYFQEQAMTDNPSPTSSSNGSSSDGGGSLFDTFVGNRGYIAYLVAAGAAIVFAIIALRWCRNPSMFGRQRSSVDIENGMSLRPVHMDQPETPLLTLEKLNAMAPVQPADQVITTMKNTMCFICLEEFQPTNNVRVLPCHHGFCVDCIDVWLTKKSSWCPVCKHDYNEQEETDEKKVDDEDDLGTMAIHPSTSSTTAPPVASSSPAPSHRSSASTPPLTAEAQPAKSQPAETQSADHTLSSDPSLPATPSQLEHRPVQDGPTGH